MHPGVVIYETPNVAHVQYIANLHKRLEIGALDLVMVTLLDKYSDKIYFDFGISM
ncbi:hypothetical protein ACWIWK_06275 [Helicobacter sp. 23-1048]